MTLSIQTSLTLDQNILHSMARLLFNELYYPFEAGIYIAFP